MRRRTVACSLFAGVLGSELLAQDLRAQLAASTRGLGIASQGIIRIFRFDGPPLTIRIPESLFDAREYPWVTAHWAIDGSAVAFVNSSPRLDSACRFIVLNRRGAVLWRGVDDEHAFTSEIVVAENGASLLGLARRSGGVLSLVEVSEHEAKVVWECPWAQNQAIPCLAAIPGGRDVGLGLDSRIVTIDTARGILQDVRSGLQPSWSPDGRMLACVSSRSGLLEVFTPQKSAKPSFCSRRPVTWRPSAIWSRDGRFLLCNEKPGQGNYLKSDVVVYDIETGARARLWNGSGVVLGGGITWLADWHEFAASFGSQ